MKKNISKLAFVAFAALAAMTSNAEAKSLYERLGGIHKIAAFVDRAVDAEAADATLAQNPRYAGLLKALTKPGFKFFATMEMAHTTGGPQRYEGPDAGDVFVWLNLTPEQSERMTALDMAAMSEVGISADVQKELGDLFSKQMMHAKKDYMPPMTESFKDKNSLYARLGGIVAIANVVDEFVNQLAADPTIGANPRTVKALTDGHISGAGLKVLVTEQLAAAAGGPWKYSGRSMAKSHEGLMISEKEWASGAGILKRVLDKFHVPAKEQGEIFTVISGTKKDIVGH